MCYPRLTLLLLDNLIDTISSTSAIATASASAIATASAFIPHTHVSHSQTLLIFHCHSLFTFPSHLGHISLTSWMCNLIPNSFWFSTATRYSHFPHILDALSQTHLLLLDNLIESIASASAIATASASAIATASAFIPHTHVSHSQTLLVFNCHSYFPHILPNMPLPPHFLPHF